MGWVPEFAKDGENCFVIQPAPDLLSVEEKDTQEARNLMDILEHTVFLPMYYSNQAQYMANHPEKSCQRCCTCF